MSSILEIFCCNHIFSFQENRNVNVFNLLVCFDIHNFIAKWQMHKEYVLVWLPTTDNYAVS